MAKQPQYAVKNRATGLLFAGFDKSNQPLWTKDEAGARVYGDHRDARGQAYLFACFDVKAQLKPVAL